MPRDPANRARIAEGVIAFGLTVIGLSGAGPLASLLKNVVADEAGKALADTVGGLGGGLAASILERSFRHWSQGWFSDRGVLNHDLAHALALSFQQAVTQLERDWQTHAYYHLLQQRDREAANNTLTQLQWLRDDGRTFFSMPAGPTSNNPRYDDLIALLQNEQVAIRRSFSSKVREYFRGGDSELIGFVGKRLANEWLLRFGEVLKDPGERGTRAWRALQRLWEASLAATLSEMQQDTREIRADVQWLRSWAQRLEDLPLTHRDSTGEEALEDALSPIRVQADSIKNDTEAIRAATMRIEAGLATLVERATAEVPSLASPSAPARYELQGNYLPVARTAFIGRKREVEQLLSLVRRSDVRLVSVTGPGGTGKTQLALEVARALYKECPDGIWFVDLGAITDPLLVLPTIGQTLGVAGASDQSLTESIKAQLSNKRLLLLLDNFEQVMLAAPLVAELLAVPHLTILVTSREVLRVYGVHEFPVPPLTIPDLKKLPAAETLTQYDAVALFVERAAAVNPAFAITATNAPIVAEICARLDGLPLAIELAAARSKVFPPKALRRRLSSRLSLLTGGPKDVPLRQQTLRSTIDWSYNLLDAKEQELFTRLGVFTGTYMVEDAEAICNAQGDLTLGVLDGLESLLDKSLLRQRESADGEPRFEMLETIREYAAERLAASSEGAKLRRQHLIYYLALSETADPLLSRSAQVDWLRRLETEHDNLRAALRWAHDEGEAELGVRLASSLWWFWFSRGYLSEGRQWLESSLRNSSSVNTTLRARALNGAGVLAASQGAYERANDYFQESLALCHELGDKHGIANALNNLGNVAWFQSDYERANKLFEESLALNRELDDKRGIANTLNNLGLIGLEEDKYEQARELFEGSLKLFRDLDDKREIANTVGNLGSVALDSGEYKRASELFAEGLALFRELEDKPGIADVLNDLGCAVLRQREYARAYELFRESLMLFIELDDKRSVAGCLENLAEVGVNRGKVDAVPRLMGAAAALRDAIGAAPSPTDRAKTDSIMIEARAQLGEERFVTGFDEGRAVVLKLTDTQELARLATA